MIEEKKTINKREGMEEIEKELQELDENERKQVAWMIRVYLASLLEERQQTTS